MGWSPLSTEVHNTSQYSARSRGIDRIVLHHGATTSADAIITMETTGSRQVSSHQVIKDARNAGIVQEQFRAWSLGDADFDSRSLTVECANESTAGWTISAASHETLARQVADWCKRYGINPNRSGDPRTWTVIGHREVYSIYGQSYSTACPGGMNLDWITERAKQLLNGNGSDSEDMIIYRANSASEDGVIPKGFAFLQGADGPLRPLSATEFGAYDYFVKNGVPTRIAVWEGDQIRDLTKTVGLMQWSSAKDNKPVLTGKLIFVDPAKADYPKVSANVNVGGVTVDLSGVESKIAALEALIKKGLTISGSAIPVK